MLALASSGVRVVLVGTGSHEPGSALPEVPAVRTSLSDLARCLIERCALPPTGLTTVVDPANPVVLDDTIRQAAEEADDVFLLYYVGHGLRSPTRELYLATGASMDLTKKRAATQALEFSAINDILRSVCRARTVLVVLDCCFSGRARLMADGDTLLLTSATSDAVALAPDGARHTLFTGELLRLLSEGDPQGPPRLTLGRVTDVLYERLSAAGHPPVVRYEGLAGRLILASNSAYAPPAVPPKEDAPDSIETTSPYLGLPAYTANDKDRFFGREDLVQELLQIARSRLYKPGPVIVTGASGAGKSSLIHAGLLSCVSRGDLGVPHSASWPHVSVTPGNDPFGALAAGFAEHGRKDADHMLALSKHDDPGRALALLKSDDPDHMLTLLKSDDPGRALDLLPQGRAVVVVDQCEELFAQSADQELYAHFARTLAALSAPGKALVVIGIRSDFYGPCFDLPPLKEAAGQALFVHPMTHAQLRTVITKPAETAGLVVEPELTEVILRDLDSHPTARLRTAALPLLSHALLATWQRRTSRRLTVTHYLESGRVEGAIATSAEELYTRMDDKGRCEARRLFLELVNVTDDMTKDTRRSAVRSDLALDGHADKVLDDLIDARLVTTGRETAAGRDTVQLSHEALLEAWPRLIQWIEEDREELLIRQRLRRTAAEWMDGGRREDALLYEGDRLVAADVVSGRVRLTGDERTFLDASRRKSHRAARIRRSVIAVLSVLALLASGAAIVALQQRATARSERDTAVFHQLVAKADGLRWAKQSLTAQLDIAAHRMRPGDASVYTDLIQDQGTPLSTPVPGHTDAVASVVFSPDGTTLASAGADDTVRLWDIRDPRRPEPLAKPLTGHSSDVRTLAFSPDGKTLASAGGDNVVRLWDVGDLSRPRALGKPLTGHADFVASVAFSPDGKTLASAGYDHTARLWDVTDPARPRPLGKPLTEHDGELTSIVFSPDGRTLATASQTTSSSVVLWDVSDRARPTVAGSFLTLLAVGLAFSPDGKTLACSSSYPGVSAILWDVTDPTRPEQLGEPLSSHLKPVFSVSFSPGGGILATAGRDGVVNLWRAGEEGERVLLVRPLTDHDDGVNWVSFSPDGRVMATAGSDKKIRLWRIPLLEGHSDAIRSAVFSPDGKILASSGADRTARLWNTEDIYSPKPIGAPLTGHDGEIWQAIVHPSGKLLATVGYEGVINLWDISDPARPLRVGKPLPADSSIQPFAAFSPDGKVLAAISADDKIQLWNVADPASPAKTGSAFSGHQDGTVALAFSPDGETLVTADSDYRLRLWDISRPSRIKMVGKPLSGHTDLVWDLKFSPDGKTLASAGTDNTVRLWNVSDPARARALGSPLGHSSAVGSLDFSPDGNTLASASFSMVYLWNITDPAHAEQLGDVLAGHAGNVDSVSFSSDGKSLVSAGDDRMIRVWDLDRERLVQRLCRQTADNLTPQLWKKHMPGTPYRAPCP